MINVCGLFLLILGFLSSWGGGFLISNSPQVETPEPGEVLQGVIVIIGSTDVSGFQSAEISFSYNLKDVEEWFLIHSSTEPISKGTLAAWDTTTISDGIYRLRILVHLEGGRQVETIVPDLRVRNYTPVETDTPSIDLNPEGSVPEIKNTPTSTVMPTPTLFPPNTVQITAEDLRNRLVQGIVFSVTILTLIVVYSLLRTWSQNR